MVLRELASESNRSNAGQSEENEARNFKPELPEYPSKVGRGCASSIQQRTAFAAPNCVLRDVGKEASFAKSPYNVHGMLLDQEIAQFSDELRTMLQNTRGILGS